ncbi:protein kinase [Streptomyces hundungensis]|uniref:protein kinase n=1 Tax=Streptomyces hundungensis TaxID=1077946 RepID=UPI0033CF0157
MDDYAGRVLADRYRLPLAPEDSFDLVETRAFDTYSGQEVLVRQLPLPEVVDAEVLDGDDPYGTPDAYMRGGGSGAGGETQYGGDPGYGGAPGYGRTTRRPADPAVRRAVEAAQAAAQIPDHPRLDQVFDVFAQAGSLWIVSELIAARPLSALLAERPMNPFRAAEVASDVLTALAVLHAHGWTHRNITARTVLICDDGRVVLTGLAAGAAEEALCGYAPVPLPPDGDGFGDAPPSASDGFNDADSGATSPGRPEPGPPAQPGPAPSPGSALPPGAAARAGVVAAYRAGARAATRTGADASLPAQRPGPGTAPSPDPEGGTGRADQSMYDPVLGVRVAGGATASPYADDQGPDSGRTRRQYDPVTGRWVPRPATPAPRQEVPGPGDERAEWDERDQRDERAERDQRAERDERDQRDERDERDQRDESRTPKTSSGPNSAREHGSSGRMPAPRTPALPPGFRADAFRADSQRRPHPSAPPPVPARERAPAPERRPAPAAPSGHPGAPTGARPTGSPPNGPGTPGSPSSARSPSAGRRNRPGPYTRTGGSPRPSAPPPICGRWAR